MNILFDSVSALCFVEIIKRLIDCDFSLFVFVERDKDYTKVHKALAATFGYGMKASFLVPDDNSVSWKANTAKGLSPLMYMDIDNKSLEQARALGVPVVLYKR